MKQAVKEKMKETNIAATLKQLNLGQTSGATQAYGATIQRAVKEAS